VSASLTAEEHEQRRTATFEQPGYRTVHGTVTTVVDEIRKKGRKVAMDSNVHNHSQRCRKLPHGLKKCALAMGKECISETQYQQIVLTDGPNVPADGAAIKLKDKVAML